MKPITAFVLKTIRYDEKLTFNFLKYNTMKKVLSIIALSAMTLSLSSFNSPETPSDCVRESLAFVQGAADYFGDDLNDPRYRDIYMNAYLENYKDCVNSL